MILSWLRYTQSGSNETVITSQIWKDLLQPIRELWGCTLLHTAGTVGVIDEILKQTTNLQAMLQSRVTESGYFVLHSAVINKRPVQVICKLLKLGADSLAKDNDGQTVAEFARASGQTLMAKLLDRAAQDTQKRATTAGTTA